MHHPDRSQTVEAEAASARLPFAEIIERTGARLVSGEPLSGHFSISTDTRTLSRDQIYLALKGERFDGARFLPEALAKGASAAIVTSSTATCVSSSEIAGLPIYEVPDTLTCYHDIARLWLDIVKPKVVAVTGSSGKTTTKEMCASVFSAACPTHKSAANENNEYGVPKTILSMPEGTKVLILELAMRGKEQIRGLARLARPDIGIITCVGQAHIELLGSVENIARAKCEMLEEMQESATVILAAPDQPLLDIARKAFGGKMITYSSEDLTVVAIDEETTSFKLRAIDETFAVAAHGRHHLADAWAALTAALTAGLEVAELKAGLRSYNRLAGRGNRYSTEGGGVLIDETYNANPDSVRCAVEAMLAADEVNVIEGGERIVVLGELAELGDHRDRLGYELGIWLAEQKLTHLYTVGAAARSIAEGAARAEFRVTHKKNQEDLAPELRKALADPACTVMIKGSRCANLDSLVGMLMPETESTE